DWSKEGVRRLIEVYFQILEEELNSQPYSKAENRRMLLTVLRNRSEGSIEFKHQNISAALMNMGLPYIKGYKARFNYQKQLLEKIINDFVLENKERLEVEFEKFSGLNIQPPTKTHINFENIVETEVENTEIPETEPLFRPIKTNYLEKEQNNRNLGEAGEDLVIAYEKWSLIQAGKESLADKVEWVSKERGDGTGFDILSRNLNGTDKYIEVKTTKLSKQTPIYLSKNELLFAEKNEKDFFLYRVFNFTKDPKFFIRQGRYDHFCNLKPQIYKGYFSGK